MWKQSLIIYFKPFEPDILFKGGEKLDEFGLPATIYHTPGHTDGGLSVVLDNGKAAVINDLMQGGMFGG